MNVELQDAIDGLYSAFVAYTRPEWFQACACCMTGEALIAKERNDSGWVKAVSPGDKRPLRELTSADLYPIAINVPLTSGSTDVLKHYLPRLLETEALFDTGIGLEWAITRINDGPDVRGTKWTDWPLPEQAAVRRFLVALWHTALAEPDRHHGHYVDTVLCAIGAVEPAVEDYLAYWLEFEHPQAATNLQQFLDINLPELVASKLWNAFWNGRDPSERNRRAVIRWLSSAATAERVWAAAQRARTDEERAALERCYLSLCDTPTWAWPS